MTHYEERLERDLNEILIQLGKIADKVQENLKTSVDVFLGQDNDRAYHCILSDHEVNRSVRHIDRLAHKFIVLHLPSAGHLRFISSTLRVGHLLERIGDYATAICREAVHFSKSVDLQLRNEIMAMASEARIVLELSVKAYLDRNIDLANEASQKTQKCSRLFDTSFQSLSETSRDWKRGDLLGTLIVFQMLLRVSDQSQNICDETRFVVSGKTKAFKKSNILFIDEGPGIAGHLAQVIARKTYADYGNYQFACVNPDPEMNISLTRFFSENGLDISVLEKKPLESFALNDFYILISFNQPITNYVEYVPFHSIALNWNISQAPGLGSDREANLQYLSRLYKDVAYQLLVLMKKLYGDQALASSGDIKS